MKKRKKYDLTVIGSGIAGLSVATRFAEIGYRVAIITKKDSTESNTNYAQGGIASVTSSSDGIDMHIKDTINAGDGLCDEKVVKKILRDGPKCIANLKEKGVSFSSLSDGRISLGKEGGHSKRRILHVKDRTGKAIEEALIDAAKNNVFIDRGVASVFEEHYRITEVRNLEEFDRYQSGYFNIIA